MLREIFDHCIGNLETEFRREFTKTGKNLTFANLADCSDQAMMNTCDKLFKGSWPTLDVLENRVREEQARLFAPQERDDSRKAVERRRQEWEDSVDKSVTSGYARNACRAFRLMLMDDVPDERKLDCFRMMNEAYGGDWALEGAKLEQDFKRMGGARQ